MASRAEQELHFITERMAAERSRREPRCWGISSDTLALWAVRGGEEPTEYNYPSDTSDLMACVLTYRMAPKHLQERMKPVLDKFTEYVEKRYPESMTRIEAYPNGDRSEWAMGKKGITGIRLRVDAS